MLDKHIKNTGKVYHSSNKNKIINIPKKQYHLYVSVDKWFSNGKIYYKMDYVLDNKIADIIPNRKIKTNSVILSHMQIDNMFGQLNIYHIPRIRPFEFSANLEYKIVSTVLEVGLDEKVNLFEKLFETKKLYIKNSSTKIELFSINKKDIDEFELSISNIMKNLTIDDRDNQDN